MKIVDISTARQENIKLEISHESHSRLIRAREVAANIYRYFDPNECYSKPNPWLPEILDYLCADIDCILYEIDKYS